MTTATANKTLGGVLLAHTQQATAAVTLGSAVDVSTKFSARVFVSVGRTVATALTNELNFRLEASAKSSGNDEWYPLYPFTTANGKTACNATTLNGATSAGATTCVVTSATGYAAGDILYFRETGTPGDSEWARIKSMSGTTVTFEEALTRAHTNGITVTDLGERLSYEVNLDNVGRIRLAVDSASSASGQTVDVLAWVTTFDSASIV